MQTAPEIRQSCNADDQFAASGESHDSCSNYYLASLLARKGDYDDALRALRLAIDYEDCTDTEALDLQARIYAQQGMLLKAESCWTEALQKEPGNVTYIAGLSALHRCYNSRLFNKVGFLYLAIITLLVAIFCLVTIASNQFHWQQAQLTPKLTSVESAQQASLYPSKAFSEDKASLLHLEIKSPHIVLKNDSGQLLITFTSGLFSKGTRFTPEAETVLAHLADQLEHQATNISVRVSGFSDNKPMRPNSRYIDNAAIGMARAMKVVAYMRKTSTLPGDIFTVDGLGEKGAPYQNNSPENRLRNRTVAIKISNK
jgi:flagellar motor protein MotB